MNRSWYRMRSTPGFERPAMAIPTFLCLRVVFSRPNLIPELLGEVSHRHIVHYHRRRVQLRPSDLFLLAVLASSAPPSSYK
jgi:hypothetical protein